MKAKREPRNRRATGEKPPVKEEKRDVLGKVTQALELPRTIFSDTPQIELMGNREAIVEGCQGVLEYDENTIRLNLGAMMLQFTGRDLTMKCLTGQNVIVQGFFHSIEFLT